MDDKLLRRAGLDYHEYAARAPPCARGSAGSMPARPDPSRCSPSRTRGEQRLPARAVRSAATGWSSAARRAGWPAPLRESFAPGQRVRLPMRPGQRSLNLSNAVAVVVFEAWRQHGYAAAESRNHSLSSRDSRGISCCIACAGARRPSSTSTTARVIGISTRGSRARQHRRRAVARPRPRGRAAAGSAAAPGPRPAQPDLAVARQVAGGGEHQVAEARQAHEGLGARAQGHAQPRHLGQAARDQRGARVQAERHAVGDAGGDGQHVLHRAADLHADRVVGANRHAATGCGSPRPRAPPAPRRRWRPPARWAGRAPPPARSSAPTARRPAARAAARARSRGRAGRCARSKPLHSHSAARRPATPPAARAAPPSAWRSPAGRPRACATRGIVVGGERQPLGQHDVGQVARIAACAPHRLELARIARPQHDVVSRARSRGQRGAPGAGTEHA